MRIVFRDDYKPGGIVWKRAVGLTACCVQCGTPLGDIQNVTHIETGDAVLFMCNNCFPVETDTDPKARKLFNQWIFSILRADVISDEMGIHPPPDMPLAKGEDKTDLDTGEIYMFGFNLFDLFNKKDGKD